MKSTWIIGFSLICLAGCQSVQEKFPDVESWTTAEGPLATRWTSQVTPDAPHSEYPRPQMVRDAWINLNGFWVALIKVNARQIDTEFIIALYPFFRCFVSFHFVI